MADKYAGEAYIDGMTYVIRRSIPSLAGLIALLMAVGFAAVAYAGAPLWFPVAFAIGLILLQYLINPFIIEWLVPAVLVARSGDGYATDHPVGELVARRCRDAGIPLVKLGIVDDGTPNAFTFGRTPRDARMWVTRGLIERLEPDELDAVITHEVGHVKNWDFAVMTVAAVIPMVLYLTYIVLRRSDRQAKAVAVGAYVAYIVSQFVLLALSRARELAADHWSCECTGNGDALASALVKVAYGMGQELAAQKQEVAALVAKGKEGRAEARRVDSGYRRAQSMRAMGIFEPRTAEAMQAALEAGIDPDRALAAMRWDSVNPWGTTLEKLSTHPLVVHRIRSLEESGLPGAPTRWSVLRSLGSVSADQKWAVRSRFAKELTVAVAPWVVLVAMIGFGAFTGSMVAIGLALIAAGGLFFVKQQMRYPTFFGPVRELTSLLERIDASPVAGIGVEVKGQVIGRGMPGYVLSPDLVIKDESGFLPLLYRQPVHLLESLFGLFRAKEFIGQEVTARGWYRRLPGPAIELRELTTAGGRKARSYAWIFRYIGSGLLVLIGLFVALAGIGS